MLILFTASAIIIYLAAAVMQVKNLQQGNRFSPTKVKGIALAAFAAHSYAVSLDLHRPMGIHLDFFSVGSLIAWLVVAMVLLSSLRQRIDNLFIGVFPMAAISLIFALFAPDTNIAKDFETGLVIHILLSIMAYSIFTLSVFQAVLLAKQEYQLKHHHTRGLIKSLPPLQIMEKLLFEMIWTGFILLTASLVTGFLVFDDLFAQHLVHKTALSIIAWLLYVVLLIGRHVMGWRSQKAVRWTVGSFTLLMLAFFGSKFVLELL